MLKFLKILLSFIVLVVLGLVVIPVFIDVNDYKPEISSAVYEATGHEIQIEHINLSVFPWIGISLKNVKLQNEEGFKQPHILTVKAIDVQLELIPLLNKKIAVKQFELDTPQIWLETQIDGYSNWQNFLPSEEINSSESPSKQTKSIQQITLNAKLLQLHDGQVIWSDGENRNISLTDIQLKIRDLQLKQPIGIDLSAKLDGNDLQVHANAGPIINIKQLDLSKLPVLLQVKTQDFSLKTIAPWVSGLGGEKAQGEKAQDEQPQEEQPENQDVAETSGESQPFGDFTYARANLDVSIEQHRDGLILSSGSLQLRAKNTINTTWKIDSRELKSLNIEDFILDIDDTHVLSLSGKIKHLMKVPSFEIRLETSKLQRLWLNQFFPKLQNLYLNHPEPWQSIKLGTLITGDADIVNIRDLQIQLNDEPLQASGNVALGSAPDAQLRITVSELHLDPWVPKTEPLLGQDKNQPSYLSENKDSGLVSEPEKEIEPDLTFLKPWYLSVQFNAKSIYTNDLQLDNLRFTLSAEKGVVRLNPMSFEIGEGQVSQHFTLYANQYPATWKETVKMSSVSIQPLLQVMTDMDKLTGIAQLNAELSGKGLLSSSISKNLSGQGHFVFEDGALEGIDITNVLQKNNQEDSTIPNRTHFTQMQGSFRINKGVLSNKDLYLASPLLRLTGRGKVYLSPPKLDFHLKPKLLDVLSGQGSRYGQQGMIIPLHVTGPFENLNVSLEKNNNTSLKSAEEQIKEKLQNPLQNYEF